MPDIRIKDLSTTASLPAADDFFELDGATNGSRKLSSSYLSAIAATRALASYGQSDGATPSRGVVYTNATRQALAGLPTAQIAFEMVVPGGSASQYIFASNADATPEDTNCTFVSINSGGGLLVIAKGADLAVNLRDFRWANFRTSYPAGTRVRGLVTLTAGTTNPVVYLNGTDVSSNFALTYGTGGIGAAPPWLDAALSSAFQIAGFNWPSGEIPLVSPIIGSLSTAERTEYFATGRLPAWVMAGGSAVSVTAGSFVTRTQYVIRTVGTTDFTLIGAASNTVGVQFSATGAGTGTGTASQAGATTVPGWQATGTVRDLSTIGGTQPNQGRLVGVRPVLAQPSPVNISVFPLSTTGAFLTLASTNPLAFTPQRIVRAEVIVGTAGADLTFRNNSSSTNDIVTALTDIPSASTATALTLIAAQTRLAPNATVWGSLSAGTGFLIIESVDSL